LICASVIRSHWKLERIVLVGRAQPYGIVNRRNVALPPAVAELKDVLAVVRVYLLAELPPERDAVVADDRGVVRQDAAARMNRHERRDDRPDPALREFHLPVDPGLRAGAVVLIESPRYVRAQDAILDCQRTELERRKDRCVRHGAVRRLSRAHQTESRARHSCASSRFMTDAAPS
jgi:hypothetical protein